MPLTKTTSHKKTPKKTPHQTGSSLSRSAGKVGIAVLTSRVLGLVREIIFAALFGASGWANAFLAAFRIPNVLRELFAEGALSAAFVPVFTDYLVNKKKKEAWRLASMVLTTVLWILAVLLILVELFAAPLMKLYVPGFLNNWITINGEACSLFDTTVLFLRIMFPFIIFISLAATIMGILNAHGKFFIPAMAPAMFNLAAVIVGGVLILTGMPAERAIFWWAFGVLAGGITQMLVQIPVLMKTKFSFTPAFDFTFAHRGLRKIFLMLIPAVFGMAATQLNIFISSNFASSFNTGIAGMYYAFRLIYLPIGIFGVALGTVTTATLSHNHARNDLNKLKNNLAHALRLNLILIIPSIVGLLILAEPIIRLVYERGKFTPADTRMTAHILMAYCAGMIGYASNRIMAPVFYVFQKPLYPVIGSFISVTTNVILCVLLKTTLGVPGLALAIASGALLNFIWLFIIFQIQYGTLKGKGIYTTAARATISAVVMGAALWGALQLCGTAMAQSAFLNAGLTILFMGIGTLLYFYGAQRLGIREVDELYENFLHLIRRFTQQKQTTHKTRR